MAPSLQTDAPGSSGWRFVMEAELLAGDYDAAGKIARLAAIRKRIWDAHRQVDEARQAAMDSQLELESMHRRKQRLETRLAHYDEQTNQLEIVRNEYESLEMISQDEFLAENPTIDAAIIDPLELLEARIQDEERRRIELFGEKIALKEQIAELTAKVQAQTECLRFKGQLVHCTKQLEETAQRLKDHIVPKEAKQE